MRVVWAPERDSIFGDTYNGVPNPNVPHVHPYPTRYHGPNYTVPGTAQDSWVATPYAKPPFMGVGAAPLFEPISGNKWLDGILGIALGYAASPSEADRTMWGIVGGIAGYAAGTFGIIGTGAALYMSHQKKG